jgi:hypothetical protein
MMANIAAKLLPDIKRRGHSVPTDMSSGTREQDWGQGSPWAATNLPTTCDGVRARAALNSLGKMEHDSCAES